jgi:chemotaxis response regulator CheB
MAQDPESAARAEMPRAAIQTGSVDFVGDLDGLASRLRAIVGPGRRGVHR